MFDKKKYWKNRGNNMRGQGEYPVTSVRNVDLSKAPRRKMGKYVTRYSKPEVPTQNPKLSNHKRMEIRARARKVLSEERH
jgi:hypothetical protein